MATMRLCCWAKPNLLNPGEPLSFYNAVTYNGEYGRKNVSARSHRSHIPSGNDTTT
jgi:hypothetical protein